MEEQTTWKGHTFTLLVFTGIVVLCSIFFILGMLLGRAQGQKVAAAAPNGAALKIEAKPAPKEDNPSFTFYDSVKKDDLASLQRVPVNPDPEPVPAAPPKKVQPAPETSPRATIPGNSVNYQVGAMRKTADAEKLLKAVKKKGFRAFIISPRPDDPNPLFRVQVGPFADVLEAQSVKKRLESAGYQPILKK